MHAKIPTDNDEKSSYSPNEMSLSIYLINHVFACRSFKWSMEIAHM